MSLIPDPPLVDGELLDPAIVRVYMARGGAGRCVMCPDVTWDWWDLSLTGLPPVTDRTGTLTDQVPLHPRCIPDLYARWAMICSPADPGVGEAAVSPDAGDRPPAAARRRPTGAYARRAGVG